MIGCLLTSSATCLSLTAIKKYRILTSFELSDHPDTLKSINRFESPREESEFKALIRQLQRDHVITSVEQLNGLPLTVKIDRTKIVQPKFEFEGNDRHLSRAIHLLNISTEDLVRELGIKKTLIDFHDQRKPGDRRGAFTRGGKRLMKPQRLTLAVMLYLANDIGTFYASRELLSEITGNSRKAITNHIDSFRNLGLVVSYCPGFSGTKFLSGKDSYFRLSPSVLGLIDINNFCHLPNYKRFNIDNPVRYLISLLPELADIKMKRDLEACVAIRGELKRVIHNSESINVLAELNLLTYAFRADSPNFRSSLVHLSMELEKLVLSFVAKRLMHSGVTDKTKLRGTEEVSTKGLSTPKIARSLYSDIAAIISTKHIVNEIHNKPLIEKEVQLLSEALTLQCVNLFHNIRQLIELHELSRPIQLHIDTEGNKPLDIHGLLICRVPNATSSDY